MAPVGRDDQCSVDLCYVMQSLRQPMWHGQQIITDKIGLQIRDYDDLSPYLCYSVSPLTLTGDDQGALTRFPTKSQI